MRSTCLSLSFALALALVLLSGCGSACSISSDGTPESLRDRRVTVVLADGSQRPAAGLRIEADSTSWFDTHTGLIHIVPTADVLEVTRRDAGSAALRGTWRGALAGAAIGFLGWKEIRILEEDRSSVTGIVAAQGAAVGAAVGALWNAPDRYVLARPETDR